MVSLAIVVVAYNREDSVRRLLQSLLKADYCNNVDLIISIDKSDTRNVEEYADGIDWPFGRKRVYKHEVNLGLRKHILGLGRFTNEYDGIIVLEDDLIVSPNFYNYAQEAVEKYQNDERIAGISLYNFPLNHQTYLPFVPEKNGYDVFLFQNAQSWGQIWMKNQWADFMQWYANNSDDFGDLPHLPFTICNWGKNSWLKYHIRYCIEKNKYFVYPYTSLTFCSGEKGVHSREINNNPHCPIEYGVFQGYKLPDFDEAVKYDAFFERQGVFMECGKDICFDINGVKGNRLNNRYWLTTERKKFKVIHSYGLLYFPIERNVMEDVQGDSIFLYDTFIKDKKPHNNVFDILNYYYKFNGIVRFMMCRGFFVSSYFILKFIIRKVLNRIL